MSKTDLLPGVDPSILLFPDDEAFAASVAGFNLAVTQRPQVAVRVRDVDDIVRTIEAARKAGLAVRVQSTGHGADYAVEGGVLLLTAGLSGVTIDPVTRTATIAAGTRWNAVVEAAAAHDLAPITGSSGTVGVVGYLLGGGFGPLARSHGVSSDYVEAFRVVTGTGALLTASASENPDLFWALKGGKGGLGVVTEVRLGLVPLTELYGGSLFFDFADALQVVSGWLAWAQSAPQDVSTSLAIIRFPDREAVPAPLRGRQLLSLRFARPGSVAEGERAAAALRALGPLVIDGLGPLKAAQIAQVHNDPTEPLPSLIWGRLLNELDAEFARVLVHALNDEAGLPFIGIELRHFGAAIAENAGNDAVGGRAAAFAFAAIGAPNPALFAEVLPAAFATLATTIAPWIAAESTVNWVGDVRDPEQFASAWPAATRERLARIRQKYDPDGVFPYGPAT